MNDALAWITPDWPAPARVRAVTTTRNGPGASQPPHERFNLGANVGEDPGVTAANRASLLRALALPSVPSWLRQVHGTTVHAVATAMRVAVGAEPEADAAVTRVAGAVLGVLTADCLPVLLCADDGSEVAAIHAGWRGLRAGVIEAACAQLRAPGPRLLAWLGPAIGPVAYEVGAEVREAFIADDPAAAAGFRVARRDHWYCDLYALARMRLARLGIERIHGGEYCTHGEPQRFYSYRRDGVTGRMATLVWIDET
ncbi:MAG: peptidoglycan editing factor PgeF [Delftia acidovorans]|nr:peptidoglycan editing factor PgeF [Delftia acidovorans]MBP7417737.1 peptidoglycan editing factor PgeF [Xanthomonadales bacterium]